MPFFTSLVSGQAAVTTMEAQSRGEVVELLRFDGSRLTIGINETRKFTGDLVATCFNSGNIDDAYASWRLEFVVHRDNKGIVYVQGPPPVEIYKPPSWSGDILFQADNDNHCPAIFTNATRPPYLVNYLLTLSELRVSDSGFDLGTLDPVLWINALDCTKPALGESPNPWKDRGRHYLNPGTNGAVVELVNNRRTVKYDATDFTVTLPEGPFISKPYTNFNTRSGSVAGGANTLRYLFSGTTGISFYSIMKLPPSAGSFDPLFNLQDSSKHRAMLSTLGSSQLLRVIGCRTFADSEVTSNGIDVSTLWDTWQVVAFRWDYNTQTLKLRVGNTVVTTTSFGTAGVAGGPLAVDAGCRIAREAGGASHGRMSLFEMTLFNRPIPDVDETDILNYMIPVRNLLAA